ncbi:MAG: hypothetical protein M3Y45_01205, partial [Actinomycetota bacterium]|nr:hypothetical protein [Actinomycetota bacterium]
MWGFLRIEEGRLTPLRAWAELAGAWSLAIAWPIFQGASSGPDALTMIRADRLDLLIFTALLVLIGPTVMWAVEMLLRFASKRIARVFHALMLGGLFGLVVWQGFGGQAVLLISAAAITVLYLK